MDKRFIVGIPRDIDEVGLVELFSAYGIVDTVTVVTGRTTGKSKGYGFITMADSGGTERVIAALDQTEIDRRTLSLRFAEDRGKAISTPSNGEQTSLESGAGTHQKQNHKSIRRACTSGSLDLLFQHPLLKYRQAYTRAVFLCRSGLLAAMPIIHQGI